MPGGWGAPAPAQSPSVPSYGAPPAVPPTYGGVPAERRTGFGGGATSEAKSPWSSLFGSKGSSSSSVGQQQGQQQQQQQQQPAAPPHVSAQQKELVNLESKRLGQRVHQLFNGGKYHEALGVAEEQMKLLRETYGAHRDASRTRGAASHTRAQPHRSRTPPSAGTQHHEHATAMNNVATLYQACGRYAEAEPLLMEASKVQQRTLGHDHPHTVASLSNLATVYEAMGQKERAAAMHSLVQQHKKSWELKQRKGGR